MWARVAGVLVVLALTSGAAPATAAAHAPQASAPQASAAQASAAQRCFEHHKFGAQPVDVAKTADGQTVLAQVSWGYHDAIGCYLTLDEQALAALRAAGPPPSLPDAPTDASPRCFEHHKFGATPVDVAKTADGQTVLARLSWGHHPAIGCYLVLDNTALTTLRTNTDDTGTGDEPDTESIPTVVAASNHHSIAAGAIASHSCAINTAGAITCWGASGYGQTYAPAGRYTAIATAYFYSCAIDTDEAITCWGRYPGLDSRRRVEPQGRYIAVAAAEHHWCAIRTDQTLDCHGGSYEDWPDLLPDGQFTAIAAGWDHSCAIDTDQAITCWGYNQDGQTDSPDGQYTAIAAGYAHSCAIDTDQAITCWGANGGWVDPPDGRYTAIAAGYAHLCAIDTAGAITCRGDNSWGQTNAPAGRYTAIAAGERHTCAINTAGAITCWGDNYLSQLETPDNRYSAIAAGGVNMCAIRIDGTAFCGGEYWHLPAGHSIAIASGGDHSCAIRADETIACWGDNREGQTNAPSGRHTAITAGQDHSCAIRADETIACWGRNDEGQTNAPTGRHTAIAAGYAHSCAIDTHQAIACWGDNREGQTNAPSGRHTAITAHWGHSCAIDTDEAITCWGYNYRGWSDPPDGRFTAVAAGGYHTCAIKTDQTIACWGNNQDGQTDSPPGQFTAIAAGWYHTCAIAVDTRMTCWGNGKFGLHGRSGNRYDPFRSPRGNITVEISVCTTPEIRSKMSPQFLANAVDILNEHLAPMYKWESSGNLSVQFEAGQVLEATENTNEHCLTGEQFTAYNNSAFASRRPFVFHHHLGSVIKDGPPGYSSDLFSYTQISSDQLLSNELTKDNLRTIQHELDHSMLDTGHIDDQIFGSPTRLGLSYSPDFYDKLWELQYMSREVRVLGQAKPSSSRTPSEHYPLSDVLPCTARIRLGWPIGDSSPACFLLSPEPPQNVSFEETPDGIIIVNLAFRRLDTKNPLTNWKIEVWTHEGDLILTRYHLNSGSRPQLELPPGEYRVGVSTVWNVHSNLWPPLASTVLVDLTVNPQ